MTPNHHKEDITFIMPQDPEQQDFSRPFSIAWKSRAPGTINEAVLLVGTSDGDWDIMSASVGTRDRAAIDVSDMNPPPQQLFIRLRYAVYDPYHRTKEEKHGQDKWYITPTPFVISQKVETVREQEPSFSAKAKA